MRIAEKDLFPENLLSGQPNAPRTKVIGLDEWWGCCTDPIVTGAVDKRTGQKPFREGEAHVISPDGKVASLDELIACNPEIVIGSKVAEFSKREYSRPTWPIVSKVFDNKHPIPHHLHIKKHEVHDPNEYLNPGIPVSHHYTTAMGLYPWVTQEMLLAALEGFDESAYNQIRSLSPHVMITVGNGYNMPNGIVHAPTNLATHEVHILMDEHLLLENITLDGRISKEAAWLAVREKDIPKPWRGDWEHFLVNEFDWPGNRDSEFVWNNTLVPRKVELDNWMECQWIIYDNPICSILRVRVPPGVNTSINLAVPAFFHINKGKGMVGGLDVELAPEIQIGKVYREQGLITQQATGHVIRIVNTGQEEFILTFDMPMTW